MDSQPGCLRGTAAETGGLAERGRRQQPAAKLWPRPSALLDHLGLDMPRCTLPTPYRCALQPACQPC